MLANKNDKVTAAQQKVFISSQRYTRQVLSNRALIFYCNFLSSVVELSLRVVQVFKNVLLEKLLLFIYCLTSFAENPPKR